jgi:folylpolyglutamate synthase
LTSNTGLYTSPHLVAVRERIRINGEPLSEEDFTRYFFEVWDLLQRNTKVRALHLSNSHIHNRPTFPSVRNCYHPPHAKLLSIPYAHGFLYFHATQGMPSVLIPYVPNFLHQVDATILEVGIGGRSDSTNIVPKPVVTGVTALGYDHTRLLGDKLSQIANQKAGIYKASFSFFSTFLLFDRQTI